MFSLTIAFQSDSSGFVSLIGYINILYAFLCDRIIFNETFSMTEVIGALVILTVTILVTAYKLYESEQQKKELDESALMNSKLVRPTRKESLIARQWDDESYVSARMSARRNSEAY